MSEARDLYDQALGLMERGSHEEAVRILNRSWRLEPHFKTLELLGECLMTEGNYKDAIVPLAAATTLNRGVRAPSLLAEAFLKLNDSDRAREMAELALKRDKTNKRALVVLRAVEATGI